MTTLTQQARQEEKREAVLICPIQPMRWCHNKVEHDLCATFSGFSMTVGHGAWRNPQGKLVMEAVYIYTIAMLDNGYNRTKLRDIAEMFGHDASQECVYVRWPDGIVEFVR